MVQKAAYTDTEAHADECVLASSRPFIKAKYLSPSYRI